MSAGRKRAERRGAPSRDGAGVARNGAGRARASEAPARGAAATSIDLSVDLAGLRLRNPVLVASGTFGYGEEYAHVIDLAELGGVVTKTITVHPRSGNAPNRVAETPSGMLNSIGLENVGLHRFRSEKLPRLCELRATVIASLGGETPDELAALLEALGGESGIGAFEINFSCPNVAAGGARFWAEPARLEATLRRLRPLTKRPLIAKLSPDVTDIRDTARACEQGGADALTAVNTFVGLAIDLEAMRSKLGKATGGVSGPAIKPLALARCHEVAQAVRIPVIGSGGIMTGQDALEFIAAGATAVQVGTATFVRPGASLAVLTEMREWLAAHGHASASELRGAFAAPAAQGAAPPPALQHAEET